MKSELPGGRTSTPRQPKVVFVSTTDVGGGAEWLARNVFEYVLTLGWDAWLVVGEKKTSHPRVMTFYESPHIDYRLYAIPPMPWIASSLKSWDRARGREDFGFPYSRRLLEITGGATPDLVFGANLHGGYFDLRTLPRLSRRVPTVLSLSDHWAFTGHCAYPLGCERWRTGCGACPHLDSPPALVKDGTRGNWRRKQRIYQSSRLTVVGLSQWIVDRGLSSMMRPAIKDARVIPAGVDLTTFTPSSNRVQIRRELGFSATDRVLLFVANLGGKNPYKDFPTLQAAIRILAASLPGEPIKLVVIGQEGPTEEFGSARIEHRAYCSDPRDLAKYYQSADLYVHAAIEEVFGIVLVEAMASGLPAVASRVGGIPEVISHGREGLLVPPRNAVALENAIRTLLSQPTRLAAMGRAARATAEIRYERTLMMDRYRNLFEEILAGQGRASVTSSVQPEDTRLVQIDSDFVAPRNVR